MSNHTSTPRLFRALFNVAITLAMLLGSALVVTPAYAAGITVNTIVDEAGTGPDCSLREAITAANTDGPYGGCTSGSGADIITLPAGTYTLTIAGAGEDANASGDLDITNSLTINGAGAGTTIIQAGATPGSGIDRVLDVVFNNSVSRIFVSISGVTIANGKCAACDGGGIHNGTYVGLTVTDSTFSGNSASGLGGGIYNPASGFSVANTTFSGNSANFGGGLRNDGGANVTDSTFSGNSAVNTGGGIDNAVYLTVTNSTFSGNSANRGGGLSNSQATATVTDSTFASNSAVDAGGGIGNTTNGTLNLTNSTLSGNSSGSFGGGIYNEAASVLHLQNNILANNTGAGGGDCFNGSADDTIATNIANLIEANAPSPNRCGTPAVSADPGLGALADNGGATQTFAITDSSPAHDAGDNTTCAPTDQRGITRPQNGICDIGAYEAPDTTAPGVASIALANPNPTNLRSVHFTVSFSEPVTGVDSGDFGLTTGVITGASVTGVSGSGTTYTVTVNTGSGNGTISLKIPATASIVDLAANPLGGLPYTGSSFYTVNKTMTFSSVGANDGWVLESSETSNVGGTLNAGAKTFNLGDDAANRQYRAILHFNTAGLPDTAVITKATLKIRQKSLVGTNPFSTHGALRVYIRKPYFGTVGLQLADFQSAPASPLAASFSATPLLGWYSALLNAAGKTTINRMGPTQFRLRFALDDNNDHAADYVCFYSGDFGTAASRPTLVIEYYVP